MLLEDGLRRERDEWDEENLVGDFPPVCVINLFREIEPDAVLRYGSVSVDIDADLLESLLDDEFKFSREDDDGLDPVQVLDYDVVNFLSKSSCAREPGRELWEKFAKHPHHGMRAIAAQHAISASTFRRLLADRSYKVRKTILGNACALESLVRSKKGRAALSKAVADYELRNEALRTADSLSEEAARVLSSIAFRAADDVSEAAPVVEIAFGVDEDRTVVALTTNRALTDAAFWLIEKYQHKQGVHGDVHSGSLDRDERSDYICGLLAEDPRVVVRMAAAQSARVESKAARMLAVDGSASVRRQLYEMPLGLDAQELEIFLSNDPERFVEFMEEILKRSDGGKWAERFEKDPDPAVQRELIRAVVADLNRDDAKPKPQLEAASSAVAWDDIVPLPEDINIGDPDDPDEWLLDEDEKEDEWDNDDDDENNDWSMSSEEPDFPDSFFSTEKSAIAVADGEESDTVSKLEQPEK